MSNKKRYLVIGDIHGRTIWKNIIEKENPDITIFLGDYVTSHDNIPISEQITNLEEILKYKESNIDKVILLRGNHDLQFLGYYWAECSGYNPELAKYMLSIKDRFLSLTQWIYIYDKTIFSHAGISKVWLGNNKIEDINNMEPSEYFGFTPDNLYDYYGTSETQPLTWIRPQVLFTCNINGWNQVVGHTPVIFDIIHLKGTKEEDIWLCDALGISKYLIIDNNIFIPTNFK